MHFIRTARGFGLVTHPGYAGQRADEARVVQESSAVGDYENSLASPGSSFLWVGGSHHLGREEVARLMAHLAAWLKTGSLSTEEE